MQLLQQTAVRASEVKQWMLDWTVASKGDEWLELLFYFWLVLGNFTVSVTALGP